MNKEFSVIDLDVHFYLNDEQKHQVTIYFSILPAKK